MKIPVSQISLCIHWRLSRRLENRSTIAQQDNYVSPKDAMVWFSEVCSIRIAHNITKPKWGWVSHPIISFFLFSLVLFICLFAFIFVFLNWNLSFWPFFKPQQASCLSRPADYSHVLFGDVLTNSKSANVIRIKWLEDENNNTKRHESPEAKLWKFKREKIEIPPISGWFTSHLMEKMELKRERYWEQKLEFLF